MNTFSIFRIFSPFLVTASSKTDLTHTNPYWVICSSPVVLCSLYLAWRGLWLINDRSGHQARIECIIRYMTVLLLVVTFFIPLVYTPPLSMQCSFVLRHSFQNSIWLWEACRFRTLSPKRLSAREYVFSAQVWGSHKDGKDYQGQHDTENRTQGKSKPMYTQNGILTLFIYQLRTRSSYEMHKTNALFVWILGWLSY